MVVSACLLGRACRYNGRSKINGAVQLWVAELRASGTRIIAVCPEEAGGLGTPRPPAELHGGDGAAVWAGTARVVRAGAAITPADDAASDAAGDLTAAFLRGAEIAGVQAQGASRAVLKARSPSCGVGRTQVDGLKRDGDGVFAALLRRNGVDLLTEEGVAERRAVKARLDRD